MMRIQVKEKLATKIYNEINSKISKHDSQIKIQQTVSLCLNLLETANGYISLILSESLTFGVEFSDFQNESLREISHEIIFLKECWGQCLKNPNRFIPAKEKKKLNLMKM